MRCTQCGMPLSPTNTSMQCPRCHTLNGVEPKPIVLLSSQQNQPPFAPMAQAPGQMGQPGTLRAIMPVAAPTPPPLPTPTSMKSAMQNSSAQYAIPNRTPVVQPQPPRVSNLGFVVAGL